MSLKSFFKNLFGGLKEVFKKLPQFEKNALRIGVEIVDNVKKAAESPVADILTAIIPGTIDDTIKTKLRAWLPKLLIELKLAESCSHLTNPNEIVNCAITTLQKINGDWTQDAIRKKFYDNLAAMITLVAADGKLTLDDVKYLIPFYYDNIYKPQK
jgi:hypothetical protein